MSPNRVLTVIAVAIAGVSGSLALLCGLGLPTSRFKPDQTQKAPPSWQRGYPNAAGCEIITRADGVQITIPGIPLKAFETSGLSNLPATESPFGERSSVSLRLRQAGISEQSKDIGGGEMNRPYSEGGIHLADKTGSTVFNLYHRTTFHHELKKSQHKVGIVRRTAGSSYTSTDVIEPDGDFIDLEFRFGGDELRAQYSTTEKPKWVHLKTFELREKPTTYGVYAFSNADSKVVFDFSRIVLTPNR